MIRAAALVLVVAVTGAAPAAAQIRCTIVDMTMTCPNGVTVQGINQSVIFGGKSFAPKLMSPTTIGGYRLGEVPAL